MSKKKQGKEVEMQSLEPAVALVQGTEAQIRAWLADNKDERSRQLTIESLCTVAKIYLQNQQLLEASLAGEKTLRERDAKGYEEERAVILNQVRELEDAHNKLIDVFDRQVKQNTALIAVVNAQAAAFTAVDAMRFAMLTATTHGVDFEQGT